MMIAKRRYKRYGVEKMDVRAKSLVASAANLLNISSSGACIASQTSLKLGGRHLILLKGNGVRLPLQCIVIWENLSGSVKKSFGDSVPLYRAGLQFSNMTSDKIIRLKDFIRISGISNDRKLGDEFKKSDLRFRIYSNESAVLAYPETHSVKKISLGGMLVESDKSVEPEKRFPMALFLPLINLPIKFKGRIASCIDVSDENSRRFDIGIEFLDMSNRDRSRLLTFLRLQQQ